MDWLLAGAGAFKRRGFALLLSQLDTAAKTRREENKLKVQVSN